MIQKLLRFSALLMVMLWFGVSSLASEGLIALPNAHSMSPLFNRYLQLPVFTAQLPQAQEFFFAPSFSLVQGQTNTIALEYDGSQTLNIFFDYESYALELPLEYGLDAANAIGIDLQLFCYAGGFMDRFIAAYHTFFGFPNNSRDNMPDNRLLIDLPTGNGFNLYADSPKFGLSDPILWYSGRIYDDAKIQLTGTVLATLPLGLSSGLGGTNWTQVALALSASWEPTANLVLHANSCLNVPLETFSASGGRPFVQFQARSGVMFALVGDFWCGMDIAFRSSPLGNIPVAKDYGQVFNMPAADLQVSLLWHGRQGATRNGIAAFTVQEDPISHNASDVGFIATGAFRF